MTKDEYFDVVARAKEYIAAGDVFQVVPSRRFLPSFRATALLALSRPTPPEPLAYLYYLAMPGFGLWAPVRKC